MHPGSYAGMEPALSRPFSSPIAPAPRWTSTFEEFSFTDEVTEDRMVTCTLDSSSKRTTFECLGETSEQTGAERERLGLALASAGGATSSSAYVIPSLLRPDLGYGQVLDFNARQVLPDSQREPILCAILEGTRPGSDLTWTLVIGRAEPFVYSRAATGPRDRRMFRGPESSAPQASPCTPRPTLRGPRSTPPQEPNVASRGQAHAPEPA